MHLEPDSILLPIERIIDEALERHADMQTMKKGEQLLKNGKRLCRAIVTLKRAVCNGAQHDEAWCMANIVQRLLENAKQHTRAHVVEIKRGRQAQLIIDVT